MGLTQGEVHGVLERESRVSGGDKDHKPPGAVGIHEFLNDALAHAPAVHQVFAPDRSPCLGIEGDNLMPAELHIDDPPGHGDAHDIAEVLGHRGTKTLGIIVLGSLHQPEELDPRERSSPEPTLLQECRGIGRNGEDGVMTLVVAELVPVLGEVLPVVIVRIRRPRRERREFLERPSAVEHVRGVQDVRGARRLRLGRCSERCE